MRFSIIIPAYNASETIQSALESLISQDYDKDDYEIIVVDDCSTDGTVETIRQFYDGKSNVPALTLICHAANRRQGAARNTGIKAAKGEWLMFLDSDDRWTSSTVLREISEIIRAHNVDVLTSLMPTVKKGETGNFLKFLRTVSNEENLMMGTFGGSVWQSCYRKRCIVDNSCLFREKVAYEDADWTRRAAWVCKQSALVDFPFYHYSYNPESTTKKPRLQTLLDQVASVDALFRWGETQVDLPESVRNKVIDPETVLWVLINTKNHPISHSSQAMRNAREIGLLDYKRYPGKISVKQKLFLSVLKTAPILPLMIVRMAYLAKSYIRKLGR